MTLKRSRSNAKADIWEIEIKSEDMVKFILTVEKSKNNFDKETYYPEIIGIDLNRRRRNAKPNIWQDFSLN